MSPWPNNDPLPALPICPNCGELHHSFTEPCFVEAVAAYELDNASVPAHVDAGDAMRTFLASEAFNVDEFFDLMMPAREYLRDGFDKWLDQYAAPDTPPVPDPSDDNAVVTDATQPDTPFDDLFS